MQDLSIGFVPLLDSAIVLAAEAKGFFIEEGLKVRLTRETSWSAIRDRLAVGSLQAAHVLAPMPIAANLGLFPLAPKLVAPIALGLGGNAVTVSAALGAAMEAEGDESDLDPAKAGAALKRVIAVRRAEGLPPLRFGVVYVFSGHNLELRYWLAANGIDPDRDIEIVVLPPPFMPDAVEAGRIDGYCAGEPWNTIAARRGAARIVTVKAKIWRSSPEKVLALPADFVEANEETVAALLRGLYRASQWAAEPENHPELAAILAEPGHLDVDRAMLEPLFSGTLAISEKAETTVEDFFLTSAKAATFPWQSHALWFYSQIVRWGLCDHSAENAEIAKMSYRPDIYRKALQPLHTPLPGASLKVEGALKAPTPVGASAGGLILGPDGFFDGQTFDPDQVGAYIEQQKGAV
ncbi:CmpA/NrtA family ABC transporter substrate-binding protein [Martelella mediterranea]|uniref:Nitrate transport protein NrtA n=1 Tax=Martelella mediterranea DSM 17316 TaxID=1122214 RepID=A0A1U9Z6X9_9HYPH|nr:CmpA/NrtA family ABC transporter substrate-binding protein [Martelella mediterranea]AQZ53473.1 Nitrate transport protein NrtA precursor [Martelella mediterranea DSM 17316]